MILNLSKKVIISSNPLYRRSRVFGLFFLTTHCLLKNDSIVFQNCRVLCKLFLGDEADIIFINPDNSISEIDTNCRKLFLRAWDSRTIVLLPKGNAAFTNTQTGDILDLNAELTPAQKKSFLRMPEIVVPLPGSVTMS